MSSLAANANDGGAVGEGLTVLQISRRSAGTFPITWTPEYCCRRKCDVKAEHVAGAEEEEEERWEGKRKRKNSVFTSPSLTVASCSSELLPGTENAGCRLAARRDG